MTTKRFARLIIYEGTPAELSDQLAGSLPEGLHRKSVDITIINLSNNVVLDGFVDKASDELCVGD